MPELIILHPDSLQASINSTGLKPINPDDFYFTPKCYLYDAAGNMTYDWKRGLFLSYNDLNLIEKIDKIKKYGNERKTLAKYSYLADGTKLSALDANRDGLIYLGSLVYQQKRNMFEAGDIQPLLDLPSLSLQTIELESAGFNGGRIIANHTQSGVEYSPQFHITDHLGSVRALVDASGAVIERNDYHPFGLRWKESDQPVTDNRYRYNGKEEQTFIDNPYIDYGARMYDSEYSLSWISMDKMAEKYPEVSPYMFCAGNPTNVIDYNGMDIDISLLDKDQSDALNLMLSTHTGFMFVSRFMARGSSLIVGDKTYKFTKDGDRSKDMLWFRSSEMSGINGQTNVYTKKNQRLDDDDFSIYNSNLINGVNMVIDVNSELDMQQTANTLGHEAFVHADKDSDALNEMDKKTIDGTYSTNPRAYMSDARRIVTGSLEDHKALGRNEIIKYKNYSMELLNITNNLIYFEMYKNDVRRY